MANLLNLIINIKNSSKLELTSDRQGSNRINNVGNALEDFIKDAFADTFNTESEQKKLKVYEKLFSYIGNKNNPPDLILKNDDAIEIKKIESKNTALALNSSYPKDKLYIDSPMITRACKNCEDWKEKDIVYIIGCTSNRKLKYLWIIYGACFSASKDIYLNIKKKISEGVINLSGIDFTETKELAKIKKVDPLGITDLRVRGMWHIKNPSKFFYYIKDIPDIHKGKDFKLVSIIPLSKWESFPISDKNTLDKMTGEDFKIKDIKIKNPNNPVKLLDSKLIFYRMRI